MSILSAVLLAACGTNNKTAEQEILKSLNQKYGEEFVVVAIGGGYGTITNNTLKVECYPKNNPNKVFEAEITKDMKTVWDGYMNEIMGDKLNKEFKDLATPIFGEVTIKSHLMMPMAFPEVKDKDMSLKDYYKTYPSMGTVIRVFVKSDKDIDMKIEAEKISEMGNSFINAGYKRSSITIFYVKASSYVTLEADYYKADNIFDYYKSIEIIYNKCWIKIENRKMEAQTTNDIMNNFLYK